MNHSTAQATRRLPALLFALALVAATVLTCANSPRVDPTGEAPATLPSTSTAPPFACTVAPEGACMLPALSSEPADYTWRDEFDRESLQPLWHWVREDAEEWSLSARPGFLRILTGDGEIWGAPNSQKNLLLQPAPSGDFQITTRVEFSPRFNFQHAGLLVYQDDDNYVHINRGRVTQQKVNFDLEVNRQATNTFSLCSENAVFLRIARQGSTYAGSYSLDGEEWTLVGRYTTTLHQPRVGISAANSTIGLPHEDADFDSFELRAAMPGFDECRRDDFEGEALDPHWAWLNEDQASWTLTARMGFLRIFTQAGLPGEENLLFQPAPTGDFLLETLVSFEPTANLQGAGLVAYLDGDNFVGAGRSYCTLPLPQCVGDGVYIEGTEGGERMPGSQSVKLVGGSEAYLRLWRKGAAMSAYYSADGSEWTLVGRLAHPEDMTRVGLSTWGDLLARHIPADFDYALVCADSLPSGETPTPTPTSTASATPTPTVTPQSTASATATHTIVPTAPSALQMLYLPVMWKQG